MQIVETIIINRANTTIDWPSSNSPTDPTRPWLTANVTITSNVSSDELSKTFVRNWHVKEEFIQECLSSVESSLVNNSNNQKTYASKNSIYKKNI
jgi:hypothetical protein